MNKYSMNKLAEEKNIEDFIYDTIAPPIGPISNILQDTANYFDKPETIDEIMNEAINPKIPFEKSRQYIPIGGRAYSEQTVKKPKRRKKEFQELMKELSL